MKRHASMNRVFRLVWSRVWNAWVAVAETARGRGKGSRRKLVAAALSLSAAIAQAAPSGGQVVAGTGSISQSGATTTIQQASPNLSLNWHSFNVAPQETVNFQQPSAAATAVNRIFDTNGTQILGRLNANGQVWLINPNGILFGQGAQVNVGGLVASTLNLNDASLSGNARSFSGNGTGSVVNRGTINAADGGYVALLGNTVSNQGTISARLGTVALGAGSAATLTFSGNSLVKMLVDQNVLASLAENGGLINADGGTVVMNAGAKNALLASVVNNTGVIEARTVENHEGVITLLGGMTAGTVNVGGTLDASAPNGGNGGFIETSAANVKVADDARVTTAATMGRYGTWLIDPHDYTVAPSGGNITGATLSTQLGTTPITLQSSGSSTAGWGNVTVNDAVSWSANTTLTLIASNDVNINANITATGNTAGLVINPNTANGGDSASGYGVHNIHNHASITLSGLTPSLTIAGLAYTVINSLGVAADATTAPTTPTLQGMAAATNLAGRFALGSDIDAAPASSWNGGSGFSQIGAYTEGQSFQGKFDGLGHTVSGLTITKPMDYVGLFGYLGGFGTIRNVGVVGGTVTGNNFVGDLVGYNNGAIYTSYATGNVRGIGSAGGLVGKNHNYITTSYATGAVSSAFGSTPTAMGGLVGYNDDGPISNSYATGSVTGNTDVGGLVGYNVIPNGGAVNIQDVYATGNVVGTTNVGGLIGNNRDGIVTRTYATGSVSGTTAVGGLVGFNSKTNAYPSGITDSIWNVETTGQLIPVGVDWGVTNYTAGLTSAEMMKMANFTAKFTSIANTGGAGTTWRIYEDNTTPWLTCFLFPLTVTANSDSKTYNGVPYSGVNAVTYSVAANPGFSGLLAFGGADQGAVNAGSYPITASGLYSVQQGNDISYVAGALTINKATLSLSGTRVYDSTTAFAGSNLTATGVNSETFTMGGAGAIGNLSTKNVQTGQALASVSGLTLGSGNTGAALATNYNNLATAGSLVDVTPKPITATGITANSKVYNANAVAILNTGSAAITGGATAAGDNKFYTADAVTLDTSGATGAFTLGKDVGTNKAVTVSGLALGNNAAGNYTLTAPSGATADITAKAITATGITANNKVYNANAVAILNTGSAAITGGAATDGDNKFYTSDAITLDVTSATGAFTLGKDVGTSKAVTVSGLALGNNAAGNYTLAGANGASADITPKAITASGITANSKVYNANDVAILNTGPATLTNGATTDVDDKFYTADLLTLNAAGATGVFTSSVFIVGKDVGTNKAVTVSGLALGNNAAGNYTLTAPSGAVADITAKPITASGITANSKVYNANTVAILNTGSAAITGGATADGDNKFYTSDAITLDVTSATGAFTLGKDVGSNKAVSVSGLALGNNAAGNYTLTAPSGAAADITAKAITATGITANSKVYNANDVAILNTGSAAITGGAATDVDNKFYTADLLTLNAAGATGVFTLGKDVGAAKAVSVSGLVLGNNGAGNYTLTGANGTAADITPKAIIAAGITANDKVYNANAVANLNTGAAAITGGAATDVDNKFYTSDAITLDVTSATGAFTLGKDVGSNKAVSVSGLALGNNAAGNYTLTAPSGAAADITAKAITASGITANSKVYNANAVAILNTGSAAITGGAATDVDNKFYTSDAITLGVTSATGVFTLGKDVGTSKAVSISGLALGNNAAGNYTLTAPSGATADITAKPITATGITANNKVYNANAVAILNTGAATITGGAATDVDNKFYTSDAITLGVTSATGVFTLGKDVGTNKTVSVSGLALGNNGAGNYALTGANGASADITPKAITATGITANNKVYDANAIAILNTGAAAITGGATTDLDNKFYTADLLTLNVAGATGVFNLGKDVGTNKAVTVSGLALGNNAAGNYTLTAPSGATADITKAHLTVTADDKTRLYGAANPTLTSMVSGFVNGENAGTAAGFGGTANATTLANATTNVGAAPIAASAGNLTATNYDFSTLVNGTLTITKAHLTVTADDKTRSYGAANPILTSTVTGFVNGETASNAAGFAGAGSATTLANATTNAGTALITESVGNLAATNYDFAATNGTLTIDKAHLTVTADDKTRFYGAANPILTSTVTGFVNGETASNAAGLVGAGGATTTASATTPFGTAPIVSNAGTLAATNYDFTRLVDGTLTISPSTQTIASTQATPTAPTLQPNTPLKPVDSAPAQMQSSIIAPQASTKPAEISLSPTLTVTQSSGPDTGAAGDASSSDSGNVSTAEPRWHVAIAGGDATSSGSGNGTVVNTMMTIGGGMGPSLRITNGGVKLPDNRQRELRKTP